MYAGAPGGLDTSTLCKYIDSIFCSTSRDGRSRMVTGEVGKGRRCGVIASVSERMSKLKWSKRVSG